MTDPSLKTVGPDVEPREVDLRPGSTALEVLPHLKGVALKTGHRTDVGLERAFNEDSVMSQVFAPSPHSVGVPVGLFAVADGMGGHAAGDVASRLAVETVAQRAAGETLAAFATTSPAPDAGLWLSGAVQAANKAVHMQRGDTGTNMGATLVAALVVGDTAAVANVGDSRAYLLGEHGITQITTDHSLVERLIAAGQITREEAAVHPQRHVIYRTLGELPQVEVDLFEQHLAPGEALLLCSDGLSGMVPDERIWQIWHTSTSPQEACDRLTEAANQAGGKDNIAVLIVQVDG